MHAAVSPRAATAQPLGRAAAGDTLDMSIAFPLRHGDELDGLLAALQQPESPAYHRWLSPTEFTERFAPLPDDYEAVAVWLEQEGFRVRRAENRLRIDFFGSVASVERTFGVRMHYYRHWGRLHLRYPGRQETPHLNADPRQAPGVPRRRNAGSDA